MTTIDRCNCPQYVPAFLIDGSRCVNCGKLPLHRSEIWCGNVLLTVQSCDHEYANIGIFRGERCTYHHVDVPSLNRQWKLKSFYWDELTAAEFDLVLAEYRDEVLALIYQLNDQNNVQPSLPMEY